MGQPAAKLGDEVNAVDIHIVLVPEGPDVVPTPEELPFVGTIDSGTIDSVLIQNMPAAVLGSGATNDPPHIPMGGPFQIEPTNQATIVKGSATVLIGGEPAARSGDLALTCDDIDLEPHGTVFAVSTVLIGG